MGLRDKLDALKAKATPAPIAAVIPATVVLPPAPLEPQKPIEKPEPKKSGFNRFLNGPTAVQKPPVESKNPPPEIVPLPVVETVAAKPLPELDVSGATVDVEKLKSNLIYLANNIEQRELVGQIVRTIAVQIKTNPLFAEVMTDADWDLFVRGYRKAYAVAVRTKNEKKEVKTKNAAEANEFEQMMKDMNIKIG